MGEHTRSHVLEDGYYHRLKKEIGLVKSIIILVSEHSATFTSLL